ncbi:MAG TPA: trypsin-like peptidase domain-containing protein [Patescibacteria group bacterium]|nr:trypsin-like peptidase domain-containing protein [Patescibacteria group bacterium]
MHRIVYALFVFFAVCCANPVTADARRPPEPTLPQAAVEAVVRVDVGGRITGSGIVITPQGHVVTSSGTILGYQGRPITVGEDRVPATVVAVDDRHQIALLAAARPLPRWARLDAAPGPARDDPARIVAYADMSSEPSMVERRSCAARVGDPHFHGDSSDSLDLHDLLIADMTGEIEGFKQEGAAVFSLRTGRLAGVVIGRLRTTGMTRLIAMPASTAGALLDSRRIAVPPAD